MLPRLPALSLTEKTDLAARILRAMGLNGPIPALLVLLGHGSQSANNPQAAGLDCGACCGQSGEINARLLAGLLNDREVRAELRQRGHDLPTHCHVLAGLHNTTTDEVQVFADEPLAAAQQPNWQRLRLALDQAAAQVRQERAAGLGLTAIMGQPVKLLDRLRQRARDWSQTRPEWGLANNAAFIAAPRARTRGVDLQGRAFLHDYEWQQDAEGAVLELIMTAPMVVAHWINLQYFTSTTDNTRFGSGNKLLHNVVGGHIGVFEGNGGDPVAARWSAVGASPAAPACGDRSAAGHDRPGHREARRGARLGPAWLAVPVAHGRSTRPPGAAHRSRLATAAGSLIDKDRA